MGESLIDIVHRLNRQPLAISDLIRIGAKFNFNQLQLASIAFVSLKTFKKKPRSSLLSFHISEKLFCLEELYTNVIQAFDNQASFQKWLVTQITTLGNYITNDLLDSNLGYAWGLLNSVLINCGNPHPIFLVKFLFYPTRITIRK